TPATGLPTPAPPSSNSMQQRHRMHVDVRPVGTCRGAPVRCVALATAVVCAASIAINPLAAQEPSGSIVRAEQVDEWLQSAETLLRTERQADALPALERALDAARQLGLEAQQAAALSGLA